MRFGQGILRLVSYKTDARQIKNYFHNINKCSNNWFVNILWARESELKFRGVCHLGS